MTEDYIQNAIDSGCIAEGRSRFLPKMMTAHEYWTYKRRKSANFRGSRDADSPTFDFLSMMDFAELYADYVCDYEKRMDSHPFNGFGQKCDAMTDREWIEEVDRIYPVE
jgi:hypothetical protein